MTVCRQALCDPSNLVWNGRWLRLFIQRSSGKPGQKRGGAPSDKRQLPLRRRAIRDRRENRPGSELPLLDVPQGNRRRVQKSRGGPAQEFSLASGTRSPYELCFITGYDSHLLQGLWFDVGKLVRRQLRDLGPRDGDARRRSCDSAELSCVRRLQGAVVRNHRSIAAIRYASSVRRAAQQESLKQRWRRALHGCRRVGLNSVLVGGGSCAARFPRAATRSWSVRR